MKSNHSPRRRLGRRTLLLCLGAIGFSSITVAAPDDSPAAGPTTACDTALYPSATWTRCESQNVALSGQNTTQHGDLALGIVAATTRYQTERNTALLADPERQPNPNPCTLIVPCPVDPRLDNWTAHGGLVSPVLFTSRSGATLSGHVWATKKGAKKRPGVVIVNGSIVGFEQIYWYAAQALAKAGFVVLTFDAQGEGNSDQFGESPDQNEDAFAGIPGTGLLGTQAGTGTALGGNGLGFYDGGEDALDFFVSTPKNAFVPVPSRSSGTSHDPKQQRRVVAGLNNAYNPYWQMLDSSRIGLAGHSYGAEAVSYLAQADKRVTTAVAWDNLCVPTQPSPSEDDAASTAPVFGPDRPTIPLAYGLPKPCFGAPAEAKAPPITKPALGITSDYFLLGPVPYTMPPDPGFNAAASRAYSKAGVDSASLVIRGGTHYEYTDVPTALPATLRGIDLVTWYTVAWFKKYLQHDPKADAMLLTARWRTDSAAGAIDPAGDPNLFSWHFRSRLDIHRHNGQRFRCEDLRVGCAGQTTRQQDMGPVPYSFAAVDTADR